MSQTAKLAQDWDRRVGAVARNLTDFTDSDAARLVRARASSYAGRTREAAMAAEKALAGVRDDYLVLLGVVDDAVRASRRSGFLSNRDDEVRALLEGPSVLLRTLSVPIARRGLLDASEAQDRATPAEVLASMERSFAEARDLVTAIAEAEDALAGRMAAAEARDAALSGWEAATRIPVRDAVAAAAPAGLDRDPLAAAERLDRYEAALAAAETRRAEAEAGLGRARERLAAASRGLDVLREAHRSFGPAVAELAAVAGASAEPATDGTRELADWLSSLRRVVARGDIKAAGIGLAKWEAALAEARSRAEAALAAARAPVRELEDLRGLLKALRAKGAALGGPGADEERAAKESLRDGPVDLAAARALVKAYERALATAGNARKVG